MCVTPHNGTVASQRRVSFFVFVFYFFLIFVPLPVAGENASVLACSTAERVLLDSPTSSYRLYYRIYYQLYYLNALDVAVDDGGYVLEALLLEKQHLLVERCVERCPRPCVSASSPWLYLVLAVHWFS